MKRIQALAYVVAGCLAVVLCLCFVLASIAANGAADRPELENRINPNDASLESLTRLPGIGPSRAQAIVTYRLQFQRDGKGGSAFHDCNDLDKVKGIGPAAISDMCEWLKFD